MDFTFEQEKWLASHEHSASRPSGSHPAWDDLRLRFAASYNARKALVAQGIDDHSRATGSFAAHAARTIASLEHGLIPVNPTASTDGNPDDGNGFVAVENSNHGGRG
ncbi:MAG: hypothetical protein R3D89_05215 [Sphingomonadaceae bacterium]|jgi:hypothetical protein